MATTSTYLDQYLEPLTEALTPELARKIADLRATRELQSRMDELAAKANEGTLSTGEEAEYKSRIDACDVIGILQLKARQFLASHTS